MGVSSSVPTGAQFISAQVSALTPVVRACLVRGRPRQVREFCRWEARVHLGQSEGQWAPPPGVQEGRAALFFLAEAPRLPSHASWFLGSHSRDCLPRGGWDAQVPDAQEVWGTPLRGCEWGWAAG